MNVRHVSPADYHRLFPNPAVVYNSVDFSAVNAAAVDSVIYAVVESDDGYPVAGLTVGQRGSALSAPFSAPFASLDFNREQLAGTMLDAARALVDAFPGLTLTLPPAPYSPSNNAKTLLALLAAGATTVCFDWNYHIDLTRPYAGQLHTTARKKIKQASRQGFRLEMCDPMRAYDIIARNRRKHGYDLRMTAERVLATVQPDGPVEADFMVLTDGSVDAAAAMVYHVTPDIAQVIYWGDVPADDGSPLCRYAMNLLAALMCEHYSAAGVRVLDIGPSGNDGIPNIGLSDFKDTIGCICSPRPTLVFPPKD